MAERARGSRPSLRNTSFSRSFIVDHQQYKPAQSVASSSSASTQPELGASISATLEDPK
ncbi:hypothetical protein FQN49_008073, partial [Arthroderma sp. PD_2]